MNGYRCALHCTAVPLTPHELLFRVNGMESKTSPFYLIYRIRFNSIQFNSLGFAYLFIPSTLHCQVYIHPCIVRVHVFFILLHFTSVRFPLLSFTLLRFPSLPFPSLRFPSLRFASLRFASLPFALYNSLLTLSRLISFYLILARDISNRVPVGYISK